MKKKIALILALIMALSLLPMPSYAADTDKLIALTFDDGPASNTKRLLDGLRERGVKCTFFLVGTGVEMRPELVRQMWEDGHQVACHSYNHPTLTSLSDAEIKEQLNRTNRLLDEAIGFHQEYMLRPPYGNFNERVLKAADVPCFYWSMDTHDWETLNANSVYREFLYQAKDGSLALLHDTHGTSVDAALRSIDAFLEMGYEFVTVSEMFYRRGITLENGKMYYSAYPKANGTADAIAEPLIMTADSDDGIKVSILGDERGKVYYTTNGEQPTPVNSKLYEGEFTVPSGTTVKAVSVLEWNGLRSDDTTETVRFSPAATPKISIADGLVTLSCDTENAEIHYTTDGTLPTEESPIFEKSFTAVKDTDYRAIAYAKRHEPSGVGIMTYTANGNLLTDIQTDAWCYEAVDRAISEGLFRGMTETEFYPDTMFSRAMLVTVLYRMSGSPDASMLQVDFKDVPEDYWCRDAIAWAYNNGIIEGYGDGIFAPKGDLSRQALCAMLARYLRFAGKDLDGVTVLTAGFADKGSIAKDLREDVSIISSLGIVCGYADGTLRPTNGATRAQSATMILRMLDAMDSIPDVIPETSDPATTIEIT